MRQGCGRFSSFRLFFSRKNRNEVEPKAARPDAQKVI